MGCSETPRNRVKATKRTVRSKCRADKVSCSLASLGILIQKFIIRFPDETKYREVFTKCSEIHNIYIGVGKLCISQDVSATEKEAKINFHFF